MTWPEFSSVFAKLALQLRCSEADEPMARSYFDALSNLEFEFVQMAAELYARRTGDNGGWFPRAPEWREAAHRVEVQRTDAMMAILRKLPAPACVACADTWWAGYTDDKGVYRVKPCECRRLRRLEILGRRPMPALPSGSPIEPEVGVMPAVRRLAAARSWP